MASTNKQYIVLLAALSSSVYTLYVVGNLIQFLSVPPRTVDLLYYKYRSNYTYEPIVFNTLYLILFIFQHSLMKTSFTKKIMKMFGLASAERAIYSLTSSLSLHCLMKNWSTFYHTVLWQVEVDCNNLLWWSFVLLHTLAWLIICGGSLIMDLGEMLGLKQAYYDMKSYRHPLTYKTLELVHLYNHVRHPSFVGFTIIFWATNLMTLDRFLLAVFLTAYMYFGWSTDRKDLLCRKKQLQNKRKNLNFNN